MRVVFMGTPEFAVRSLQEIVENSDHEVVGVVTVPDRPAGRGQKMVESAVKVYAHSKSLPILQPDKLRDPGFQETLRSWNADVFVVVAFRMLPESVWKIPKKGTFNLHGSLLPQYRGAAPINWAVINGEDQTGVTTFLIDEEIDTGNILLQRSMPIGPDENAGDVHDRMMSLGARLVVETLDGLEKGSLQPHPQNESKSFRPAPKIFKEDTYLDLRRTGKDLYNKVRGLSPYPGSILRLYVDGEKVDLKIWKVEFKEDLELPLGQSQIKDGTWSIGLETGGLELLEIQWPGKKRMTVDAFLRGFRYKTPPKWEA
mgnify:FL=1